MKLATKPNAKLIIVAIMHLLTDAIGISAILRFADSTYHLLFFDGSIDGVWIVVIYTICSFGLQPFFGLIMDSVKRYTPFLYMSALIMALQSFMIVVSPLSSVCIATPPPATWNMALPMPKHTPANKGLTTIIKL